MSAIIEKRRICAEIEVLRKELLAFDKLDENGLESVYAYSDQSCCPDQLLICVFDEVLKNIACSIQKMEVTKEVYIEIADILTQLKCAVQSVIANNGQSNIDTQNLIISKLFARYNCMVEDTTFCDCFLFTNTSNNLAVSICPPILIVEVPNLVCEVSYLSLIHI